MSMFRRRLAILALLIVGTGAGIAQAQSPYAPQTTPATATTVPITTTVLPTTVVSVPPTPASRAKNAAAAVADAFSGISRKNLLKGTKVTLTINGIGTAIVQFDVTKKGKKTFTTIGKLHLTAGASHKLTLKLGKAGKTRLADAASKGKKFKLKIIVVIYSARGTGSASKTITVQG